MCAGSGGGCNFGWIVDFGMALTTAIVLGLTLGVAISQGYLFDVSWLFCTRPCDDPLSPEISKNFGTHGYTFGGTVGISPPVCCAKLFPCCG